MLRYLPLRLQYQWSVMLSQRGDDFIARVTARCEVGRTHTDLSTTWAILKPLLLPSNIPK